MVCVFVIMDLPETFTSQQSPWRLRQQEDEPCFNAAWPTAAPLPFGGMHLLYVSLATH